MNTTPVLADARSNTLDLPANLSPDTQERIRAHALAYVNAAVQAVQAGQPVPDLKLEPGCPAWCDRDHSEGAGYHQHDVLFEPWGRVSVVEEHDAERGVYRIVDAWLNTDVREHELDAQQARKFADALTRAADMLEEIPAMTAQAVAGVLGPESTPLDLSEAFWGSWSPSSADALDPFKVSGALPEGHVEAWCLDCRTHRLVRANWRGRKLHCKLCREATDHAVVWPLQLASELSWKLSMLERLGLEVAFADNMHKAAWVRLTIDTQGRMGGFFVLHPDLTPRAFSWHLNYIWQELFEGMSRTSDYKWDAEEQCWRRGIMFELQPEHTHS